MSRVFAVIDDNHAVCTLWAGSNKPDLDTEIHKYDLPGDYWIGDWWSPFSGDPAAVFDYMRFYAQLRHRYGDRLVPFANANWLVPDVPDFNLMNLSAPVQREAIEMVRTLWQALDLGPLEILASYTFGHETPQVAQKLGIKAISSLCTWQNWLDGSDGNHWKINHWGAPNAPYFVGQDDFRQVAPGKSIVAFSMGTASSVRNYSIFTMEGCPSLTCPMQRYRGTIAQSQNITRFYDAVDGWLSDARCQTEPLFFTVGLENFVGSPDWAQANDLAVDYLVANARTEKLVFASAADIADYYQTHYAEQPETCYYQPDIYCGYRANAKPAVIPDRIEVSNRHLHTLHRRGQALPQFFWDFCREWDEPEWLEQPELRNEFGLIPPEQVQADTCIPRMVNTEGVRVQPHTDVQADRVTINIDIESANDYGYLPIAIWDIPLEAITARLLTSSDETRLIRTVDSVSENLHGVAICANVRAGQASRCIILEGTPRAPKRTDLTISDHIVGRTITRDGIAYTYLWRQDGVPVGNLRVAVPTGRTARVRYNDGEMALPDGAGVLDIRFDDDWTHEVPLVIGLSTNELQNCAAFAPQ